MNIFIGPYIGQQHALMLEMNPGFNIVQDTAQADIIVVMNTEQTKEALESIKEMVKPHHVLLVLELFHIDKHHTYDYYTYIKSIFINITKKIIVMHTNLCLKDQPNLVYYDHLFDRQKLYCTDYDTGIDLNCRVWTYNSTKEMYALHPIKKHPYKKFLALMRIYHSHGNAELPLGSRMLYRKRIKGILSIKDESFISDNNSSASFLPYGATSFILPAVCKIFGGIWFPVSHLYYDSSLISVYAESIVNTDKMRSITEKTFDPLIQGNFILPFGYSGLIKDILDYGFKLPSWIDYSYDTIEDDEERFNGFSDSLQKLIDCPHDVLFQQATNDIGILEHNRSIFFSRPYMYPTLVDKIKSCIEYNEANDWQ
jgi:nitrate reductase NapAB chaperone NapD